MLFDAARHEPLCNTPWDPQRAHAGLQDIVRDIERSRALHSPQGHWPVHPSDDEGDTPASGFKSLYLGSAGLAWALWHLQQAGAVQLQSIDPVALLHEAHAAYIAEPDTGEVVPSFYLGEVGILLALSRATGDAAVADRLHHQVQANIGHPALEPLWAAPGTMLAAWHLWRITGEARWSSLFLQNVDALWERWDTRISTDEPPCWIWTQDLYGQSARYLGAAHGFAGNVHPMLKGAELLAPERRAALYRRTAHTLQATAAQGPEGLNWPPQPLASAANQASTKWLVQWCHGAPGIITALADFPVGQDSQLDAMLLAAGEAVWNAGPLAKGPGLCHGTAGNGQALLVLYERSGDMRWLDRARAFAMHALIQVEQQRETHRMGRFNLWTGDAGVAIYLWQCLQARAGMPTLDFI
ncbi:LanC-like protein [Burkholderiaceae bacterium UC74_6]